MAIQKSKKEQIAEYEARIQKSQAIEEITLMDGWKVLESWIKNQVNTNIGIILKCPKEEMPEGRGYIKAYKSVLLQVEKWIKEKDRYYQKIKEIQEKK
jgi:hypothetical protein